MLTFHGDRLFKHHHSKKRKTTNLNNIHVSKELLHGKDLIAVIIWEKVSAIVFTVHVLRLWFVPGVVCCAVVVLLCPQLVLFAVLSFRLW